MTNQSPVVAPVNNLIIKNPIIFIMLCYAPEAACVKCSKESSFRWLTAGT